MPTDTRPGFMDFFAGSGLVTEGLRSFFRLVWANDIDSKKGNVFLENNPDAPFVLGPIQHIKGADLPEAVLSWASFPCQDLSLAGNLNGLGGTRSGLVYEWLRVMDEMRERPPLVVAENVAGLVSAHGGKHYRALHASLVERGYRVGAVEINAWYWVPQSRPRVFVVAVRDPTDVYGLISSTPEWAHSTAVRRAAEGLKNWVWWILPEPTVTRAKLEQVIDVGTPCPDAAWSEHNISLIPRGHYERLVEETAKGRTVFLGYKRIREGRQVLELRFDGLAGCLRTPNGGSSRQIVVYRRNGGFEARLLSTVEAARLMGVRDTYKFPGSYNDRYRALGDAVAVPVITYLAQHLLSPLAERMTRTAANERRG